MKSFLNKTAMNKSLLAAGLVMLLPLANTASAAEVSGGTVNFNGSLVSSACAISANSANINVYLGQVRTSTLATAGSESGTAKRFSIVLDDCDASVSQAVAVTFTGTPDNNDPGSLSVGANGGSGSAQNVALRFFDEQGSVIKLGEASSAVVVRDGQNTLNFGVKYYSPTGAATAGDASAIATYTLSYS